jgi:hypothetical protein
VNPESGSIAYFHDADGNLKYRKIKISWAARGLSQVKHGNSSGEARFEISKERPFAGACPSKRPIPQEEI